MKIEHFFDPNTFSFSHIIIDEETKKCAIIDSVMDYDPVSGKISYQSADNIIGFIKENDLQVQWILETHIHADHLTAASYLKEKLGGASSCGAERSRTMEVPKIAIGEGIKKVLKYWTKAFNIENEVPVDGSLFDHIFADNEEFKIGNLSAKFITTAGHTPACGSYLIEDVVFVGDLMMMPNIGTGRVDFPEGSASEQFVSIQKIFSLPAQTRIFTAHDYPNKDQKEACQSTVEEEKSNNIFAKIKDEKEYVKARTDRDKNLAVPRLLFPSIQVNLRCGALPDKEKNGTSYIKIPLS